MVGSHLKFKSLVQIAS